MIEGLYSAASGMLAQQQRLEAISSDIANVNTPGYRHLRTGFQDLVYDATGGQGGGAGVRTGTGVAATDLGRSDLQGALQRTDRPLDVAIDGPGFLQVRRPDGGAGLTRAGALQVDGQGRLGTAQGPLEPPVRIPAGTDPEKLAIAPDGTVTAEGRTLGRIRLVDVPAPGALGSAGDGLLLPTAGSGGVRPAAGSRLEAGALEASNVEISTAMVEMMDAQKAYALSSRAVQTQDQVLEIANGVKR